MSNLEGRPIVRRFVIRRHDVTVERGYPWAMRDRDRPAYLGQFPTFAAAIEAMITKLRQERGLGPRIRWDDPGYAGPLPNHCKECGAWGTAGPVHLRGCSQRQRDAISPAPLREFDEPTA